MAKSKDIFANGINRSPAGLPRSPHCVKVPPVERTYPILSSSTLSTEASNPLAVFHGNNTHASNCTRFEFYKKNIPVKQAGPTVSTAAFVGSNFKQHFIDWCAGYLFQCC